LGVTALLWFLGDEIHKRLWNKIMGEQYEVE
jgi:hypothetical protein